MAEGGDAVPFAQMQPIDQYILARTAELTRKITAAYAEFEFHRVYHLLNEFLNSELSAFYLDVLKDRLYTFPIKYKPGNAEQQALYLARRSAQTAIYKITDALARLTAPILSFTADEVYQSLPHTHGSVHLALFPTPEDLAPSGMGTFLQDWEMLLGLRQDVLGQLEVLRVDKSIGKSLDADVVINALPETLEILNKYQSALAELFNVSQVHLGPHLFPSEAVFLKVQKASDPKCDRCWRHVPDVGKEEKYPTVCHRCAEALDAIDFPPYATNV
jgi:isoleucyl-tRNA synthetase